MSKILDNKYKVGQTIWGWARDTDEIAHVVGPVEIETIFEHSGRLFYGNKNPQSFIEEAIICLTPEMAQQRCDILNRGRLKVEPKKSVEDQILDNKIEADHKADYENRGFYT